MMLLPPHGARGFVSENTSLFLALPITHRPLLEMALTLIVVRDPFRDSPGPNPWFYPSRKCREALYSAVIKPGIKDAENEQYPSQSPFVPEKNN